MSAALRIALSALPFLASIVYAWHGINAHMGQAAPFMVPSPYGLLLGLYMVTVGSIPLVIGGALSALLARALRLRPPVVVGVVADRWLSFFGPIVYFAGAWLIWWLMWQAARPMPTRDAPYGTSYFWLIALVGLSWSVAFGAAAWAFVVRDVGPAATREP